MPGEMAQDCLPLHLGLIFRTYVVEEEKLSSDLRVSILGLMVAHHTEM